jgi:hypothetical protein
LWGGNQSRRLTGKPFYSSETTWRKMTIMWDATSCGMAETDRYFRHVYCLHHQGHHPDDEGSNQL